MNVMSTGTPVGAAALAFGGEGFGWWLGCSLLSLLGAAFLAGLFYLVYYLYSLPMRRREVVRLFLDLIASGQRHGESIEQTVLGVAQSGDRSLGKGFRLLAARLQEGIPFAQAIELRPRFLPVEVVGALQAGVAVGDLARALPASRAWVRDGTTEVWKAHHYLALLAFVVTPAWAVIFTLIAVFVLPRYQAIAADMGATFSPWLAYLTRHYDLLMALQAAVLVACWGLALLYLGGPRLRGWFAHFLPDRLAFATPWRRKRMQRDFSATLAVLLDGGVPEGTAVELAAATAGNARFAAQAKAVATDLAGGRRLPEAVQRLEATGEFQWRLANAAQGRGRFVEALSGWHESLEAQAFQQEQTVAQLVTTALVFFNGIFVAALAVGIFQMLLNLIQAESLW